MSVIGQVEHHSIQTYHLCVCKGTIFVGLIKDSLTYLNTLKLYSRHHFVLLSEINARFEVFLMQDLKSIIFLLVSCRLVVYYKGIT